MTHYIIVKIEGAENKPRTYIEEILSNLESVVNAERTPITGNILIATLPKLAENLITLYQSCMDRTEPVACTAALANFTGDLAKLLDIPIPDEENENAVTELERFLTISGKQSEPQPIKISSL